MVCGNDITSLYGICRLVVRLWVIFVYTITVKEEGQLLFNNQFDNWKVGYYSLDKPGVGGYIITFVAQVLLCWIIIWLIETSAVMRCCYCYRRRSVRPTR